MCSVLMLLNQLSAMVILKKIKSLFPLHISISTTIKIEDVFAGTLVRHPCMSRVLSSFALGNTYLYSSRFLTSFALEIQKSSYKKSH